MTPSSVATRERKTDMTSAPITGQPGSQQRGRERRRVILDSATRLFSEGGFNRVSLADIAEVVGITQAGLLHHFPTKAALLIAVLQEREAGNAEAVEHSRAEGVDPLTSYFRTLESNDQNPGLVQLFVLLSAEAIVEEHPGHDWFVERGERLFGRIVGYVEEVIDVDKLPAGLDAAIIARWIMALSHGLGSQWVLDTTAFSRHEYASRIMILLEPYLRQPATKESAE